MFPRSHFSFVCVRPPRPTKMDASSLAAAALAVAMEDSRSAAVRELMLDRERAAMANEDARSYLAQRHFVGSLQMPNSLYPPMTWREAYLVRSDDMTEAREIMRRATMDAQRARDALGRVVSEIMPNDEVEEEPEEVDEVMEVEAENGGMQSE